MPHYRNCPLKWQYFLKTTQKAGEAEEKGECGDTMPEYWLLAGLDTSNVRQAGQGSPGKFFREVLNCLKLKIKTANIKMKNNKLKQIKSSLSRKQ